MNKVFLSLSVGLGAILMPVISSADEDKKTNHTESLQQTEKRLNTLIKTAAEQDLIHVNRTGKNISDTQIIPSSSQTIANCSGANSFSFPPETRVENYENLLLLKTSMDIGPEQIDSSKAKRLALAYLGLGFGEEAMMIVESLEGDDKAAIRSMAKILMGLADSDDLIFIRAQAICNKDANIWLHVLEGNADPLSDEQASLVIKQIQALPNRLQVILGQRLGIKAAQNNDLKTAQAVYEILLKLAPTHSGAQQVILSDDLLFFEALLAVNSGHANQKTAGIKTLKDFAKSDGLYQAYALQALSKHLPKNGDLYPGYMQDLDISVQTYSGHPIGKQALAQKIELLAQNHLFKEAIDLTKSGFSTTEAYFDESALVISRQMLLALKTNDENTRIWALENLLSEAEFFAGVTDASSLKAAGILACIDLGIPKLAAHIMPVSEWHKLDKDTLKLLAVSYLQHANVHDIDAYFPGYVFDQTEFEAKEIEVAFYRKKPKDALEISARFPDDEIIQNAILTNSWNNGYWSIVDKAFASTKLPSPSAEEASPLAKQKLAATLSMSSPVLIMSNKQYGINDFTDLQTHIDTELSVFRSYLYPDDTPNDGNNNG